VSHAPGEVIDANGAVVGYFEYNGTVDVARPKIFPTAEARDGAWRQDQPDPCDCPGVEVTLVSGEFQWDARGCLEHGFIVDGSSPIYGRDDDTTLPLAGNGRRTR